MIILNIQISPVNNILRDLEWHSSANILCNYMRKMDYLLLALKVLALKPRYFEERLDYLGISGLNSIAFPMLCFCDIPLSKVGNHMKNYGGYGLAIRKQVYIERVPTRMQFVQSLNLPRNWRLFRV